MSSVRGSLKRRGAGACRRRCRGMSPAQVVSVWTLLLGCFNTGRVRSGSSSVSGEMLDITKVSAVTGGDAALSCDTRTTQVNDVLMLVVWYKDGMPVYSYDGRVTGPSSHWSDGRLGGRARWRPGPGQSSVLQIRGVAPADRALYSCRVDFKISPTINHKILLNVIEPPEKPKILDELDKELVGFAGPYVEDISMKLTCVVSGGDPMPRVRWWRDDQVVSTLPASSRGSLRRVLELRVPRLSRDYYQAVFSCSADNTALVPPLRTTVQIQLYLRPLLVELLQREQPLTVQQMAEVACRSAGAAPPALLSWWLDDQRLNTADQNTSVDQNETLSVLRWTPRMADDGRVLACRATHPVLRNHALVTQVTLHLNYVPIVALKLGSNLNAEDVEEGDDVYFECVVRANPPAYKVIWEYNGQPMSHSQRGRVLAGAAHLVLRAVTRHQAGRYVCAASNVEGDGASLPVVLKVFYKPTCKTNETLLVGATVNERVRVACEVDAYPPPVSYQWLLNNSLGSIHLDSEKLTTSNGSVLLFRPRSTAEFGTLGCQARNAVGQQAAPCRAVLMPATRPDPPRDCAVSDVTEDELNLRCVPGYEGGLQTTYAVEARAGDALVRTEAGGVPAWRLRGLPPGSALQLLVFATNARGRSPATTLGVHTQSQLALHTEATPPKDGSYLAWTVGVFAGLVGTVTVAILLTALARSRCRRSVQYAAPIGAKECPSPVIGGGDDGGGGGSPVPDDKNPDVVQLAQGLNSMTECEPFPRLCPYGMTDLPSSASGLRTARLVTHSPVVHSYDTQDGGLWGVGRDTRGRPPPPQRREIITTRMTLLANARESRV